MNEIPTIKVKNPSVSGFMIINQSDYNPDEHELWEEPQSESVEETVEEASGEEQPARKRRERRSEVAE